MTIITKGFLNFFTTAVPISLATTLLAATVYAGTVEITYDNAGTSVDNAGLHELTIDGVSTFAMAAKPKPPKSGKSWTATVNSYDAVQAGAGKFNESAGDEVKYNRTGWLFNYMNFSETPSDSSQQLNAAISQAVWKIMGKKRQA
jgi:hypothetical protein